MRSEIWGRVIHVSIKEGKGSELTFTWVTGRQSLVIYG